MGETTTGRMPRAALRRCGPRVVLVGLVIGLVAPLSGCSVPRDAKSPAGAAADATAQAAPAVPPPPVVESAASSLSQPSPSAPSISSFTASPPKRVLAPTPAAVPGYTVSRPRGSVGNPLAGVKGASDVFGPMTVRSVARGSTSVGLLFLFAVRPEYAADPAVAKVVLSKVTTGIGRGGAPVTMQTFGRQRVGVASSAKNGTIVVWLAKGVLAVVVGVDHGLVTGYARAYITAR